MLLARNPSANGSGLTTYQFAHRIFLLASVVAASLHISSVLIAGSLTPGYSQVRRAISDLGCNGQPYSALLNYSGLIIPGFLFMLAAYSANKILVSSRSINTGLGSMACAGASLIIAGIFPFPSLTHLIAALLSGFAAAISIASLSSYAGRQKIPILLKISGYAIAFLILADAATWVIAETRHFRLHPFMGLQQRIGSFSAFIWFSAFALISTRRINMTLQK